MIPDKLTSVKTQFLISETIIQFVKMQILEILSFHSHLARTEPCPGKKNHYGWTGQIWTELFHRH